MKISAVNDSGSVCKIFSVSDTGGVCEDLCCC